MDANCVISFDERVNMPPPTTITMTHESYTQPPSLQCNNDSSVDIVVTQELLYDNIIVESVA
jgi:hypothetical protein